MITLAPVSYDPNGVIKLPVIGDNSEFINGERRLTRTRTLDLGVTISDNGFTHGDRTLRLEISRPSLLISQRIAYLCEYHSLIQVAAPDGAYIGVISNHALIGSTHSITILLKEKVS